jgi:hypothetical protein
LVDRDAYASMEIIPVGAEVDASGDAQIIAKAFAYPSHSAVKERAYILNNIGKAIVYEIPDVA